MKKKYLFSVIAAGLLSLSSCSGFLDQDPDTIITNNHKDIYKMKTSSK